MEISHITSNFLKPFSIKLTWMIPFTGNGMNRQILKIKLLVAVRLGKGKRGSDC